MSGMNLTPLIPEPAPHALAQPFRPAGATFGYMADVEPHSRIDVPEAQSGDDPERDETARNQERRIEISDFLRHVQRFVRPREDVILSDENQNQQDERDREERDVSLEQADDRARPPCRGNALNRNEHHAGRGDGREIEPVDEQRLPHPVDAHYSADDERGNADNREDNTNCIERARERTRGASYDLFSSRWME